jgi:hypothetical protein
MAGMLGDILIDRGQLTEAQLNTALKTKHPGQMLGDRLLAMGVVSSAQLGSALAEQFEVPFIDVEPQAVDSQIVRLLPEDFLRQSQIVPIEIGDQQMTLTMVSPDDIGYFCIQVHPELTNHRPLSVSLRPLPVWPIPTRATSTTRHGKMSRTSCTAPDPHVSSVRAGL